MPRILVGDSNPPQKVQPLDVAAASGSRPHSGSDVFPPRRRGAASRRSRDAVLRSRRAGRKARSTRGCACKSKPDAARRRAAWPSIAWSTRIRRKADATISFVLELFSLIVRAIAVAGRRHQDLVLENMAVVRPKCIRPYFPRCDLSAIAASEADGIVANDNVNGRRLAPLFAGPRPVGERLGRPALRHRREVAATGSGWDGATVVLARFG